MVRAYRYCRVEGKMEGGKLCIYRWMHGEVNGWVDRWIAR